MSEYEEDIKLLVNLRSRYCISPFPSDYKRINSNKE